MVRRPDLPIFIVVFINGGVDGDVTVALIRGRVALIVFSMNVVAEGDEVEGGRWKVWCIP